MGTHSSSKGGSSLPTTFLSFGKFFPEHKEGKKASPTSVPIGACFNKTVKDDAGNYSKHYLIDGTYPTQIFGKVSGIKMTEKEINNSKVKYLSVTLADSSEKLVLQMPLFTQKGAVHKTTFELVSRLLSVDNYGVLVLAPWLAVNKQLKQGDKFVSFSEQQSAGLTKENWDTWKQKFPTATESVDYEAKLTIFSLPLDSLSKLESDYENTKKKGIKVQLSKKQHEYFPKQKTTKVVDGEEVTIDNQKKITALMVSLVTELEQKFNSFKEARKSTSNTNEASSNHSDDDVIEEDDSFAGAFSDQDGEDDLPF